MSPRSILLDVTGLCAPSVLMPDWNQVQVSSSSACGHVRAISCTMAAVPASATSCSGTPMPMASTTAAPPRSAMRVIDAMCSISSPDLIMRRRMVAGATSTNSTAGKCFRSSAWKSRSTSSNSMPTRFAPFSSGVRASK